MNTLRIAEAGAHYVAAEFLRREYPVNVINVGRSWRVDVTNRVGDTVRVRPRTKTTGDWQGSINETVGDDDLWLFVDLSHGEPAYYVKTAEEMVDMIQREHQAYLDRNGGHRARNDASDHAAITLPFVQDGSGDFSLVDRLHAAERVR